MIDHWWGCYARPASLIRRASCSGWCSKSSGAKVDPADVVAATVAAAEQDAAIGPHHRLADLDIKPVAVEGDSTGNGDAGLIGTQIVVAVVEAEGLGKRDQLAVGIGVELMFGRRRRVG